MQSNQVFEKLWTAVQSDVSRRSEITKQITHKQEVKESLERRLDGASKARTVIQVVAELTQSNLEIHIASLVTTALKAVSPDFPEFALEFTTRRNQPECDLYFVEKGEKYHPLNGSGGGPKDIASFALKIGYWSLKKNSPTFVLDEPFHFVSPDLQEKVSEMIEMLSKELGVQIIMVSHADSINVAANKTFLTEKKNGISQVKEVN
uniref:Putative ATPase domain containing protein n=1 Tax=viral metagenome TaxID=1070528 RepID=A0A6M3Y0E4_9ZZZZ